jgi:hypothetical protein
MHDSLPIPSATSDADEFAAARRDMVETQLRPRGILDRGVLAAMQRVPLLGRYGWRELPPA